MTYTMRMPVSFGEYFLDGEYAGWNEVLEKNFLESLSEEEKSTYNIDGVAAYAHYVTLKFKYPVVSALTAFRGLPTLKDYECPKAFAITFETAQSYGSLVYLANGLIGVDDALKGIIEDLEPDTHQFWPIEIIRRDGSILSKTYYGMRVGQFLKSFQPEKTPSGTLTETLSGYHLLNFTLKDCATLTMSKELIGTAHLWRESRLKFPELFLSDVLVEVIRAAKLRVPNMHKVNLV